MVITKDTTESDEEDESKEVPVYRAETEGDETGEDAILDGTVLNDNEDDAMIVEDMKDDQKDLSDEKKNPDDDEQDMEGLYLLITLQLSQH